MRQDVKLYNRVLRRAYNTLTQYIIMFIVYRAIVFGTGIRVAENFA